jgi:hypothetical protein
VRHRSQICRVYSRRSRYETPAPVSAPGNDERLPGRSGQRERTDPFRSVVPIDPMVPFVEIGLVLIRVSGVAYERDRALRQKAARILTATSRRGGD